ncbi:MAG: hypothetical protein JXA10_17265, partial [Anaerolineae bacterium]|nr:hypothetical protein [Anaerolineae bacterium]
MKRIGIVAIGLSVLWLLVAPALPAHSPVIAGVESPGVPRPITSAAAQARIADWTVMVYMAADNNLETFALADLNEMELVGSSEAINIVVQVDRAADYDAGDGDWTDTRRYFIQNDRRATNVASERVDDGALGELDTSDPATLADFGIWAITTYPANHYALVIWDHGGSWQGLASDEFSEYSDMSLSELTGALDQITTTTGVAKLDVIGFDACLMGSFEVYAAIAPYSHYAIASAELIPGDGWDYFGALDALTADPAMGGDAFGRAVVDTFITYYTDIVTRYTIFNLGVVDLSQSDRVAAALGEIKDVMQNQSGEAWAAIVTARTQTAVYGAFGDPQFVDIWAAADLIQFAGLLKDQSEDAALVAAADHAHAAGTDMVVYYRSSVDPDVVAADQGGVSIYFPRTANLFELRAASVQYTDQVPADLTLWSDFLSTFFQTVRTQADAEALGGKVEGVKIDGSQAALVFDMSEGKPGTRASAFVKLDIGNNQRIVVDYAPLSWSGDATPRAVAWSGKLPWLTNGYSETPVLLLRHPRDPNIGVVNGVFYPRNGAAVDAQLLFDRTTNALLSVWTLGKTASTVMPAQVVPQSGDVFQPVWVTSNTDNVWAQSPANVKMTFADAAPLTLAWR